MKHATRELASDINKPIIINTNNNHSPHTNVDRCAFTFYNQLKAVSIKLIEHH